jgi:hypothetical protein
MVVPPPRIVVTKARTAPHPRLQLSRRVGRQSDPQWQDRWSRSVSARRLDQVVVADAVGGDAREGPVGDDRGIDRELEVEAASGMSA